MGTPLLAWCPLASGRGLPSLAMDSPVWAGGFLLANAPTPLRPFEIGPPWVTLDVWAVAGWRDMPFLARCLMPPASERRLIACYGPTGVCQQFPAHGRPSPLCPFVGSAPPRVTLDGTAVGAEVYGALLSSALQLSAHPLSVRCVLARSVCFTDMVGQYAEVETSHSVKVPSPTLHGTGGD